MAYLMGILENIAVRQPGNNEELFSWVLMGRGACLWSFLSRGGGDFCTPLWISVLLFLPNFYPRKSLAYCLARCQSLSTDYWFCIHLYGFSKMTHREKYNAKSHECWKFHGGKSSSSQLLCVYIVEMNVGAQINETVVSLCFSKSCCFSHRNVMAMLLSKMLL